MFVYSILPNGRPHTWPPISTSIVPSARTVGRRPQSRVISTPGSEHGLNAPLSPHRTMDERLGLAVVLELLLDRVPFQLSPADAQADVADVTHRNRPVPDLRVADRLRSVVDALDEVAHMIVRDVQANRVRR